MMLGRETPAIGVAHDGALGDREQHVVGGIEIGVGEMSVVGRDQRQVMLVGEVDERRLDAILGGKAVAHQLDVEPAGEERLEAEQHRLGGLALPLRQKPPHRARWTASKGDQAAAHALERREIDLRHLAGVALEEGLTHELREVGVADPVLHQHHKRVRRRCGSDPAETRGGVLRARAPDRQLAADKRLNPRLGRSGREFQRAEEITGVRHGDRRHAVALTELHQLLDLDRARRERIGGMDAEVNEISVGHGSDILALVSRPRDATLHLRSKCDRSCGIVFRVAPFTYSQRSRAMGMHYLHTMVRVTDLEQSLDFFCNKLGMVQVGRSDNEKGRYTLVFLAATDDVERAKSEKAPMVELTYNWDKEDYTGGRNFGHLAYEVDDIYATCDKLMKAGITINRPPRDGRMAFIRTPDNISIELLQKGQAKPIAEPWASMKNTGVW